MIDSGDTTWIMVSTGLVLLMIGGVGLLEAGLIRSKNTASIFMKVLATAMFGLITWFAVGFTLAFGSDVGGMGIIGGMDYAFLMNVGMEPLDLAPTIPGYLIFLYQGMFAAITIALISGGIAERMRFGAWLAFIPIWMIVIYTPLAHSVWGGGWLAELGGLDFAGGWVVHVSAGFASLAAALVLGKRKDFGTAKVAQGHNIPYQFIAMFLLWLGWNGFNGGSALAADGIAVTAIVGTNLAAAGGALTCMLAAWYKTKKPSTSMGANGAIAGMAGITPAAGFIEPWAGLVVGLVSGLVFFGGILLIKEKYKVDDACDVIAIHGLTGVWGAIAIALFASPYITSGAHTGLVYGSAELIPVQLLGTVATALFCFGGTVAILKLINFFKPIRVTEEEEEMGEDIALHGEIAYPGEAK